MKSLELNKTSQSDTPENIETGSKKENKEDKIAALIEKANTAYEREMEKRRKLEDLKKIEKIKSELIREMEDKRMEEIRGRENSLETIKACRERRDSILEKRGLLRMPKEEFEEYFSSKDFKIRADLKQGNTADCYLVAAIHALSNSPHYEMIVRSSMKRLGNGSWVVKIPLLGDNQKEVHISPDDIKPQENPYYSRLSEYLGVETFSLVKRVADKIGIKMDNRKTLNPVKGDEGLQALEAAFIKYKFGTKFDIVDRLSAEWGWADDVLIAYGGNYFKDDRIYADTGKTLRSLPKDKLELIDKYLETFDSEAHIATVSSKSSGVTGEIAYQGINFEKKFVSNHSYSVLEVNQIEKTIKLSNPWDTSKSFELTFDQFKDNFAGISGIRIDNAKLLKKMEDILEKTT